MKKSILIKALAASVCLSATLAVAEGEDKAAQVYDVKVTLKTTRATRDSVSALKNAFISESDTIVFRTQGSQTWNGVIWGCSCDAILGKWMVINQSQGIVAGCVIWDTDKSHTIVFDENIHWRLLNAIDKDGTKCEGAWTIGDSSDNSNAFLAFAGFGTLSLSTQKSDGNLVVADCLSFVRTISGNVAGWMPAPFVTTEGKKGICTFCYSEEDEQDVQDYATAWSFCSCAEFGDSGFTAVSGTWTIKYNASLSKKLRNSTSILDVYKKFPENVKAVVAEKISATLK